MSNTWFVDFNNGSDTNSGADSGHRVKTLSKAATLAINPGDTIRVAGKPSTNSGTATWTKNSNTVTLSAAINQLLYGDGAWTAGGANVTASTVTSSPSPKQGTNAAKLACNSSFTNGLIGSFNTGTLNLSAYKQVCLWIQASTSVTLNTLTLNLCSGTNGSGIVNSLPINVTLNANQWTPLTLLYSGALAASIQSISITAGTGTSMASNSIVIDNVFTAKDPANADCLTLNTLISPDNATWYSVQNVNGTAVQIDGQQATAAGAAKAYQGATGSTTFYMLQPTVVSIGTASSSYNQVFSGNGSAGNQITISGGWDAATMTSQTGWTSIDMTDWTASGVNLTGTTGYVTVDHFNFAHSAIDLGIVTTAKGLGLTNSSCVGAGSSALSGVPTHGLTVTGSNFLNCAGTNYVLDIPANANYNTDQVSWNISNSKVWGSTVGGIRVNPFIGSPAVSISGSDCSGNAAIGFDIQSPCAFLNNAAYNNGAPGVNFQSLTDLAAYNVTARGNTTGEVQVNNANVEIYGLDTNNGVATPQIFFPNNTGGKAVVSSWTQYAAGTLTKLGDPVAGQTANNTVSSHREGGNPLNNSIYSDYGTITTTGVTGEPGTGIGWKLSPSANAFASSPLHLNLGKVACLGGSLTTITYWAKFSAAGPSAQLKVFGGRYPGVGSAGTDVVAAISGTTWTQYSVAFTPSENCVVDVFAEVWGSSTQSLTLSGPVVISQ
jgi:hypothetical protein